MKRSIAGLCLGAALAFPAAAQQYFDLGLDLAAPPAMEAIPDSPVYYAPGVDANYFFCNGLYWNFHGDAWYASPSYNGPWAYVEPAYVPTNVLVVPVRYYRRPPAYFRNWAAHRPPAWSQRWGPEWQQRHRKAITPEQRTSVFRAPLPGYIRREPPR